MSTETAMVQSAPSAPTSAPNPAPASEFVSEPVRPAHAGARRKSRRPPALTRGTPGDIPALAVAAASGLLGIIIGYILGARDRRVADDQKRRCARISEPPPPHRAPRPPPRAPSLIPSRSSPFPFARIQVRPPARRRAAHPRPEISSPRRKHHRRSRSANPSRARRRARPRLPGRANRRTPLPRRFRARRGRGCRRVDPREFPTMVPTQDGRR